MMNKRGSAKARDKYLVRAGNKWRAHFYMDGAVHYIGTFDSKINARLARDVATASDLPAAQARAYALQQAPQKTKEQKANTEDEYYYRPNAGSRLLLSEAIISAKTSDLNLRRVCFRTAPAGQIFYYDGHWYVKRSSNNAARADTHQKYPLKYFAGRNVVRVLADPQQPFHAPPQPVPAPTR